MHIDFLPLKQHTHFVLLVEANASVTERDRKCILVNALQKSRPQGPMNFDCRLKYSSRQSLELMAHRASDAVFSRFRVFVFTFSAPARAQD